MKFDPTDPVIAFGSVFGIACLIIVVLFILFPDKTPEMQAACEQRGGILLQRTYQSGKHTYSLYTCIKKEMVIDYDIEH